MECRNDTLMFVPKHRYLTRVAHSVNIGNPLSIFSDSISVVHISVLVNKFAHKFNLEPLPVACRRY